MLKHEKWYAYVFIAPMVIGYLIFLAFPILSIVGISFTDWSLIGSPNFIGLKNYERIATDMTFWVTVKNTLLFTAGFVPLKIIIAFLLALLILKRVPGIGLFRTAIFTPVVVSLVVWAVVWKYILATDYGLINSFLHALGYDRIPWLYHDQLTLPAVIVVSVLKGLGLTMIIFLAALSDVPKMYYEAAIMDGASKFKKLLHITIPLITPAIFLNVVITVINSMKIFGQIYVMTHGGPGTSTHVFIYYIYKQAFKLFEFGYGSAISLVFFLIVLAMTIFQWNLRKRWVHHEQ